MEYANLDKHRRAVAWAKEEGKEGDEAAIKAQYIALGGKVLYEDENELASPVDVEDVKVSKKPKK